MSGASKWREEACGGLTLFASNHSSALFHWGKWENLRRKGKKIEGLIKGKGRGGITGTFDKMSSCPVKPLLPGTFACGTVQEGEGGAKGKSLWGGVRDF